MIPILPQIPDSLQKSIDILKQGGIIAHPADTCYGLLGDFLNPDPLQKIQQLKGRDAQKPMSVMWPLSHLEKLRDYVMLNEFSTQVCHRLLPGPVTLLLPKGPKTPAWYFLGVDRLGVRIPEDGEVQALLEAFGGPLITTSANLSGQPLCMTASKVSQAFEGQENLLPLILESERALGHLPSTVIEVGDDYNHRLRVLRLGPWGKVEIGKKLQGMEFEWV